MEHETQQALGWFNSEGFIPHGHCYLWEPELLWTLVISDSIIALSYFTIPFGLMYFVSKRPDLKFNWIFKLFSVFILACGITHLYDVWTIWHPDYWPMAFAKAITAAASLLTAGLLWPLIPRAIKLPSTSQLEALNARLLAEIEQRKLYEAELTALKSSSDTRYRILFESSRDALLVTAPDGRFLSGNPAAIALLGCLNESDFTALTPAKVSPEFQPDGRRSDEKAQEMIRLALESGSHTFEWMHQRVDGVPFTTEVLLTRVELDNKILLQASVRDISERKRAEQLIKEEKAFSDTLILSLPDVFYLFDQQGNMLRWSHKGLEMFGLSAEEMSRTNVMDLVYEEDRPLVTTKLQQVFETGSARVEARLNLKDGVHDYILSARSIKTQHGVNVVGVGIDITERKKAEESLRKLSQAVEQSPSSIMIANLNAEIEYVNTAFLKTTGYSLNEVIGNNPRLLQSGKTPKKTYEDMWTHLKRGEVWQGEFINRRKDGSEYIESVLMSPVRQADGSVAHYLAIKEDITERKQTESRLIEQLEELRRWHDSTMGREGRILELKHEVNELLVQTGEPARYPSAESDETIG